MALGVPPGITPGTKGVAVHPRFGSHERVKVRRITTNGGVAVEVIRSGNLTGLPVGSRFVVQPHAFTADRA